MKGNFWKVVSGNGKGIEWKQKNRDGIS